MRLSICIAFHKRNRWLGEMMESMLNSGYHFNDTEILICDDGSDTSQPNPLDPFVKERPELFRLLRNEEISGLVFSRQRMMKEARGTYVMLFDSDDIFVPFDIDKSLDFLDKNPNYCATYGKKFAFSAKLGFNGKSNGGAFSPFSVLVDPRMTIIGMILRHSDILDSYGFALPSGTFTAIADDINLWAWLCAKKRMKYFHEVRAFYREHDDQLSVANLPIYHAAYERVRSEFVNEYRWLYDRFSGSTAKMSFAPEEVLPAIILLGIMMLRAQNYDASLRVLDIALQLSPDDFCIREYYSKVYTAMGRPIEALSWALEIISVGDSEERIFNNNLAYSLAKKAVENVPSLKSRYEKFHTAALKKLFTITQAQNEILQKACDNAKKYDLPATDSITR